MRDGDRPSNARTPLETGGRRKSARLTQRSEFLAVAAGRRFHTDRLTVQGLRRAPASNLPAEVPATESAARDGGLRVGLTVTKRVGHATERNRIRRRLRAAVDQATVDFAGSPLDVVLVGRRDALAAPFATLVDDIARALPVVSRPASNRPRAEKPNVPSVPHHGRGRGPVPPGATRTGVAKADAKTASRRP